MKNKYIYIIGISLVIFAIFFLGKYIFTKKNYQKESATKTLLQSSEKILNIYIWGEYLTDQMVKQFTTETGIKVNVTQYDNNETMFAKLRSIENPGYDIAVPSSYYVERMIKQNMLHEIDQTKFTNLNNLNPFFLNKPFDPKNKYSIPYLWGSTGILVNTKYIKDEINSWKDLWNPKYKNQLLMFNDIRDFFSVGLLALGYSANDTNPEHIKEAYLKLKELLPNIKLFGIDAIPNIYIDEDAIIGMIWGGEYKLAEEENYNLKYIYPKEGFSIWVDSFVILKNAPHVENAHKFINYMLRTEIAKQATLAFGHSTTNLGATKLMPKKWQKDPINNPEANIIKRGEILLDPTEQNRTLYEKYWEMIKLGG